MSMRDPVPPATGVDPETNTVTPPVPPPGAAQEPLLTVGTITAATTAILALVVALGLPVSNDTQAAILGVVAVVAPLVLALLARRTVWAPATVRATVNAEVAKVQRGPGM
jgi:hypothetical protein